MTESIQRLDDALLKAGVFALSKKARLTVAEALMQADITASDVDRLEQWVILSEPRVGLARRYLAGLLSDAPGAAQAIGDLKKHENLAAGKNDRNAMNYAPAPAEGEDEAKWEKDRQCRIAHCRINGDKADESTVAAELGVSETELATMVKIGESMQRSDALND